MKNLEDKWMYLMIMFDLPVKTKKAQKAANQFRNFLKKQGYIMINYSVYARFIKNNDYRDKFEKQLKQHLPNTGNVKSLLITEKQFQKMQFLVGEKTLQDKITATQLTLSL